MKAFTIAIVAASLAVWGCSEGSSLTNSPASSPLLEQAEARFQVLRSTLRRSLPLEQQGDVFHPAKKGGLPVTSAHRLESALPARSTGTMKLSAGPVTLMVRAVGVQDVGAVSHENALLYEGIQAGADSVHLVERGRVEEFILLHHSRAPRVFHYKLEAEGGEVRQLEGVVEVLDREGNARLRLEPPFVVDAAGELQAVAVTLRGSRLTLGLPPGLHRYPALLDPGWTDTRDMASRHKFHAMVELQGGKALLCGGKESDTSIVATCELYDPKTDTWTLTASLSTPRAYHEMVLLSSGKVLAAGGEDSSKALDSTELYDPATGKWAATGSMATARSGFGLVQLKGGEVLAAAGWDSLGNKYISSAELYDPKTGKWTATGSMAAARWAATTTLLPSGKVLAAGGADNSKILAGAEVYDPKTGTWSSGGNMIGARASHQAVLLPSGKVLISGGLGNSSKAIQEAELYDPATGKFTKTGNMGTSRIYYAMTLLFSGQVLATGGQDHLKNVLASAEVFDEKTGKWSATSPMATPRRFHTAVPLAIGAVLVTGGEDDSGMTVKTAETFDPTSGQACTGAATCASGHCVDGICCPSACTETCKQCVKQTSTQGTVGRCVFVGHGQSDAIAKVPCVSPKVCDGGGNCKLLAGTSCTAAGDCIGAAPFDVIPLGATWKYHDKGVDQGTAWLAKGFNDSGWSSGKAQLGYGDGDETTKIYDPPGSNYPSVYFRKKITLAAPPSWAKLKVIFDDGFAAWINGTLVASKYVDHGTKYSAWASQTSDDNEESNTQIQQTSGGPFVKGENVVAVMVKQRSSSSSDTSFDLELKVLGSPGYCTDGVCCDTACDAACYGCNVTAKAGTCSPLSKGATDLNAATPCSGFNACDGKGNCKKIKGQTCNAYTECVTNYCVDLICCDSACAATCYSCGVSGAKGTCTLVPAGKQDLVASSPCTGVYACDGQGVCKKSLNQKCTSKAQCSTGFCVDSFCCYSACTKACKSCGLTGSQGFCSNVPKDQQDNNAATPCTGAMACDGKGNCLTANGGACAKGSECVSGHCVDGYCCDSACMDQCKACNLKSKEGTCSKVAAGQQDKNATVPCTGTQSCGKLGTCLKGQGQACKKGNECGSDYCVNDYCCDGVCNKDCQACNLSNLEGTCSPYPKDTDPENDCIGKDKDCGGLCDGKSVCVFPGVGKGCGTCKACDGTGNCNKVPTDDSTCGVIDCDQLDTSCRDYTDLKVDRCASFGACKKANDPTTCTAFSNLCAGPDKGTPTPDKGVSGPDAGGGNGGGGCDCRVAAGPAQIPGGGIVLLLLTGWWIARRRRSS